jgi:hypothetical protein
VVADSQPVKTTEKGTSKASMAERKLKLESGIYWLIMKANRAFVTAANLEDREGCRAFWITGRIQRENEDHLGCW